MLDIAMLTRRQFGQVAGPAIVGMMFSALPHTTAAIADRPADWPLGCFNRPWGRWTYDEALDDIKDAGFKTTGLLGEHRQEPFILPEATEEYLDELRDRLRKRDLPASVAWLRTQHTGPLAEARAAARKQIDHAHRLGVQFLLSTGVDDPEKYEHYYQVMRDAAEYAAERKMQVTLKPHGGCSATAAEILRCVERVKHDHFRVWYDAGNIVHYTDADPVADVGRLAELVVGFSAKDCGHRGGDVMLQFGEGKVDFASVFQTLQKARFRGPVMVECCRGSTRKEVAANVRRNREFLERLLASL
jgi:sugar phosphate isomerase/epimerase